MSRSNEENSRSRGFENRIKTELEAQGVSFHFEPFSIPYRKECRYVPDIVLPNGIIVEIKGWFKSADRKKHRLIKAQHPELDIRFVFGNPDNLIGKQSSTTYAKWCETNGFKYAHRHIPQSWLNEPVKPIPKQFKPRGKQQ